MKTTHWKKLTNPDYIGAYSLLPNEHRVVEIESVTQEMVTGAGGSKELCIVAKLKGEKPFILNKTNCKTISKIAGSPYIEKWSGVKITIYATNVSAFGQIVEALRVEQTAPQLPELTPTHKKWESAKIALTKGQVTIEQIKKNYKLSIEDEKKLTD